MLKVPCSASAAILRSLRRAFGDVVDAADESGTLPEDAILRAIDEHGERIALVLLPGVQYLSGQAFPIPGIQGWNLVIGFGIAFIGFLMTTRWR